MISGPYINIVAILGSTRKHSTNKHILAYLDSCFPENVVFKIYDELASLPIFNPDLDANNVDDRITTFRNLINHADALVVCSPEYVFSIPGALKNAIEWLVSTTILSNKPGALITASTSGEKADESLQLIMKTLELNFSQETTLLIKAPKTKLTKDGLLTDAKTKDELFALSAALVKNILQSKKPF